MARVGQVDSSPVWSNGAGSRVSSDRVPGGSTPEEKFAAKIIQALGHVSFDVESLARTLTIRGGSEMQGPLLKFAKAIIRYYANSPITSNHTDEAHRIHRHF